MNNYRIYRVPKNLVIQRKRGKEWRTISYHGNSLDSLISGLFELIMAQHTPIDENLLLALADIKLELIRGIQEVKEMVEKAEL